MFGSMGITELVLILFIVLVIFGAGKLPQLGEGLGKAIKGFKKSVHVFSPAYIFARYLPSGIAISMVMANEAIIPSSSVFIGFCS